MKAFAKKITLFILPLVLLSIPIEVYLSTQLKKSKNYANGEYAAWNDIYEGTINSEVVIYGSSRAGVHLNPQLLDDSLKRPSYNLGCDGYTFEFQYFKHQTLLKHNTPPKFIILSLDIFSFENRKDLFNADLFLPYMMLNSDMKDHLQTYKGYSDYDFYIPLVRYYGKTTAIRTAVETGFGNPGRGPERKKGFWSYDRKWNDDFENARLKLGYYYVHPEPATLVSFNQFLLECSASGIQLIFVYSPEFIDGQKFVKNRARIMTIYKRFASYYKIPFFDYSNDPLCFEKKYFYNASHLNRTGADLFTKKFILDLKQTNALHGIADKVVNH